MRVARTPYECFCGEAWDADSKVNLSNACLSFEERHGLLADRD